ncbi:MAG: hypothetical protein KGL67_00605 [Patescibacteria group bacterium]|nr:hypothetical protein [Patescibacteria group bacterium]
MVEIEQTTSLGSLDPDRPLPKDEFQDPPLDPEKTNKTWQFCQEYVTSYEDDPPKEW